MHTAARQPRPLRWLLVAAGLLAWQLVAAGPATALPGQLDPSFGGDGKVTTAFGGGAGANAVVVQDGKLVAAGFGTAGSTVNFALARYRRDGSLDPSFGSGGRVVTDIAGGFDQAHALAVQDGKLVAGGTAFTGTTSDFALARYRQDGTLDPTFGAGGKVTTDVSRGALGGDDVVNALVVRDGSLVAAGSAFPGSSFDFALARYRQDGALDAAFGDGGTVTTDFAGGVDSAQALVVQGDRLVAAGFTIGASGGQRFALARYR